MSVRVVILTLVVCLSWISEANAVIYKCVMADGGILFTQIKENSSCKVTASAENAIPAPPRAKPAGAAANPSPAGFPRVQEDTQKARDGDRRHILEQELAGEQRHLELARKDLSEQQAAGSASDRIAPYRDRVGQHERNIQAIQKELGNLK